MLVVQLQLGKLNLYPLDRYLNYDKKNFVNESY